jgi:carnitine 3-dehydrogenase
MRKAIDNIKTITCVGVGTIGAGWATYYLSRGFNVIATDPGKDAEQNLHKVVDDAWHIVMQLNPSDGASRDNLSFTDNLEEAVKDTDFIQESAPDREDLKINLFKQIDSFAPNECIIASSSSDFLPTRLASECEYPERCIIGHPFAPSYLMPLVEVVGGEKTDPNALNWSMDFYNAIGKKALLLKKEINSYVANRFQNVVLTEAISMVEKGICDFDDIDAAMSYGPGLRWAFAGPAMCYHLGGGKGGLEAMIEQFGFDGNEDATRNLIKSVKKMSQGKTMDELEHWRDENLLTMIKNLKF